MRVWLVLVSFVFVGLALWLCWPQRLDAAPPVAVQAESNEPAQVAANPSEPATSATKTERSEAPPVAAAAPAVEVVAYRVRCVLAGDRKPVAGAVVHWIDQRFDWSKETEAGRAMWQTDQEQFLESRGHRDVADAEGRLTVSAAIGCSLVARRDHLFAQSWVGQQSPVEAAGPFQGEHVVELAPDRELTLRAVDGRGAVVSGAFLVLTTKVQDKSGGPSTSRNELPPADDHGLVVVKHAQTWGGSSLVEASACSSMVGGDGPPVSVDLHDPPKDPVDVVVLSSGSLEVVLLWPDGRQWTLTATSTLNVHVGPPNERSYSPQLGRNMFRFDQNGRAIAAPVPCGTKLVVSTQLAFGEQTVDGPARPGDRVRVELRLSEKLPVVVGRLLGSDRRPFDGVVTVATEGGRGFASSQLSTEPDGRFRVALHEFVGNQPSITFERRDERTNVMSDEAEIVLRTPLVPGINDVGDIVLAPPPILVAGRVVDGEGKPAKGVYLQLEQMRVGDRESWQQAYNLHFRLDEESHFEVRALPLGHRFRVCIRGSGVPMPPIEFTPGTTDMVIKVERGGSVTATFLADPLLESLVVRLVPLTGTKKDPRSSLMDDMEQRAWLRHDDEKQRFTAQWSGLAAAQHQFQVACSGMDPLVDITVTVPAGGEADDPRLRDIDLRGKVRRIEVEVTDIGGARLPATARVFLHGGSDPDRAWYGQEVAPGVRDKAQFVVSQPVELVVTAKGFRSRTVPGVFSDTRVALEPAPTVTLHVADLSKLPAGVSGSLRLSNADQASGRGPSYRVDRGGGGSSGGSVADELMGEAAFQLSDGRATWHVGSVVPVKARLFLRAEGKRGQAVSLQPVTIDPAVLQEGQTIELRCDPDSLKKAIEGLGGK
jgi:hypothetical protein